MGDPVPPHHWPPGQTRAEGSLQRARRSQEAMLPSCWAPSPQGQSLAQSLVYPSKVPVCRMNDDQIKECHLTFLNEYAELIYHCVSGMARRPLCGLVIREEKQDACMKSVLGCPGLSPVQESGLPSPRLNCGAQA